MYNTIRNTQELPVSTFYFLSNTHIVRHYIYVCMYIYIYIYVYVCVYVYISIYLSIYIYIYTYTHCATGASAAELAEFYDQPDIAGDRSCSCYIYIYIYTYIHTNNYIIHIYIYIYTHIYCRGYSYPCSCYCQCVLDFGCNCPLGATTRSHYFQILTRLYVIACHEHKHGATQVDHDNNYDHDDCHDAMRYNTRCDTIRYPNATQYHTK